MGFGQHMKVDDLQRECRYPVSRTKVKTGRMTKAEILAGVTDADYVDATISAHNEVTIQYKGGFLVCRLRETDIVAIGPGDSVVINTGGWNTITTRRHVVNFLKRHGFQISLWGDKKRGGNVLTLYHNDGNDRTEIPFKQRVVFNREGGFKSDLIGNPAAIYLTWESAR